MSDVSKTKDLIGRLRSMATDIDELLDDPESLLDIDDVAVIINEAADALATRVPVQGEPNDDREASEAEIQKAAKVLHMAKCCDLSGDSMHDFPEASELFAAGVVLNSVPRAAVPDAATEELERIKPLFENLSREYPNECNKRVKAEAERDDAKTEVARLNAALTKAEQVCAELVGRARHHDNARTEAEAERDAALAAVERVRAIHVRDTPSIGGDWCLDDHHKWPCPTIQTLGDISSDQNLINPHNHAEVW